MTTELRLRTFVLCLGLILLCSVFVVAKEPKGPRLDDESAQLFQTDRITKIVVEVTPDNWQLMLPTKGLQGFGAPEFADKPKNDKTDSKTPTPSDETNPEKKPEIEAGQARGGFKFDFRYVRGNVVIDGERIESIGLRFKGNSSYGLVGDSPKRPFKIDFDRYVPGRRFRGVAMLNLTNNAFDPSQLRETLAFRTFRMAGVPAARTALAEVYLHVPGRHENQFVGLYTLTEQVDEDYLKRRFGKSKGMLLKPEGFQGLPYLGDTWEPYAQFYRPKTEPGKKAKQRLMHFARLVSYATDEEFAEQIEQVMDMENFYQYLACCSVLVNADSFIGFGHNYFLYLNPENDRFVWLPWDMNGTFGAMGLAGSVAKQVNWSVDRPWIGYNRLAERVLAVPRFQAAYRKTYEAVFSTAFEPDQLKKELAGLESITKEILEREAELPPPELPAFWKMLIAMGEKPPSIESFIDRRVVAIQGQLSGSQKGNDLALSLLPAVQRDRLAKQITKPIMTRLNTDKKPGLTREEVEAGVGSLLRLAIPDGKKKVSEAELADAIVKLIPRPSGLFAVFSGPAEAGQPRGFGSGQVLAGYVTALANRTKLSVEDSDNSHTKQIASEIFARWDLNRDDMLSDSEVTQGLTWLPPVHLAFDPTGEGEKK